MSELTIFSPERLNQIYDEIKQVYLSDSRPWIIGYSGGKDSTAAVQLVWSAISELSPKKRVKPVFVISSDTLVETPIIIDFIDNTLENINRVAKEENMPFHAEKVRPIISDTFWVNLIGRGYPAPKRIFRWCTHRLKIKPANTFILEKVSKHGEAIVVLGVRKSESATRAQVMNLYEIKGTVLSRHTKLTGAYVYTPIKNFSLEDVWGYLLQYHSPWGGNNSKLLKMYRDANAGECPLVVDKTTPSCGNSRFGCWVCTVVANDKAMEALLKSGIDWMEPLFKIRNFLSSTQDPSKKHIYRDYKRRTGTVGFNRDGSGTLTRGPYWPKIRVQILRKVLEAEVEIRNNGPDKSFSLISPEELFEIRRLWRMEWGDWEDTVPRLYSEVTGNELSWIPDDVGHFGSSEAKILSKICLKSEFSPILAKRLINAEISSQGMKRRSSIYSKIDKIFGEEWRTEEEILEMKT